MGKTIKDRFTRIFKTNGFEGDESISGPGSNLIQTERLVRFLPELFRDLHIKRFLDAPCGDFHWMSKVNLDQVNYLGLDIVKELVDQNRKNYESESIDFQACDIINENLPNAELLLCRDCLVHLSFDNIMKFVSNFKSSSCEYLLTTTFPTRTTNIDIKEGVGWRPLNLEISPIRFPEPILLFNEGCTENDGTYHDKSLGLWHRDSLNP